MLAGAVAAAIPAGRRPPGRGVTMFGVTTPCVTQVRERLGDDVDPLVFHATGTGGRAMEKLADSGLVDSVLDLTTTEIADLLVGGVMAAGEDRLDAIARTRIPYVGSCGALDMVNFGAPDTVPERFSGRLFYEHNAQVTLMRTTVDENVEIGRFLARKIDACPGPLLFLLPTGGVCRSTRPASRSTIRRPTRPCSRRSSRRWTVRNGSPGSRRTSTTPSSPTRSSPRGGR